MQEGVLAGNMSVPPMFLGKREGMRAASVSPIMASLMKYLVEGLAVALVAYAVPQRKLHLGDTAAIALTAAATFAVLDAYAPAVAGSARLGAGFGVGGNLVGFGREGIWTRDNGKVSANGPYMGQKHTRIDGAVITGDGKSVRVFKDLGRLGLS